MYFCILIMLNVLKEKIMKSRAIGLKEPQLVVSIPKGWAVRPLKRYASWVQNVVRQFGPYPARAEDI